MKKAIWNLDASGNFVQLAPPSTQEERAAFLRERGWGEEAGIPHGKGTRTCTGGGEETENLMILPEGVRPEDLME